MARPLKEGLDYFPLDTKMDDKFELLEAKYGTEGTKAFGCIIKIYQRIYDNGYYHKWDYNEQLLFSKRINVDINVVNDYIKSAVEYGIFDEQLFNDYKILTSTGIQKRFFEAIKRRKEVKIIKKYIIVNINQINANIKAINVDISTQSKVKKSKEKESNTNTNTIEIKLYSSEDVFKIAGVSVDSQSELFKRYEIKSESAKNNIRSYLINGMQLEVIDNGLGIPFNRNVIGFDFESDQAPIENPTAYGLAIIEKWAAFGVKNMDDVKKYNKLYKSISGGKK